MGQNILSWQDNVEVDVPWVKWLNHQWIQDRIKLQLVTHIEW